MVSLTTLWLPILLSAAAVFAVSSALHMLLRHHAGDFGPVPDEDGVREALKSVALTPGEYVIPHAASPEAMKEPEYRRRCEEGPVAFLTVLESGPPTMAKQLVQWFLYCGLVSLLAAYVTGRALGPGAEYLSVFRFAGTAAFAGYVVAFWQTSIWFGRPWSTSLKYTGDGLVYALVTAGFFGWLWPG